LGLQVRSATIVPGADALGYVVASCSPRADIEDGRPGQPSNPADTAKAVAAATMYAYAGRIAEQMAGFVPTGFENDERDAAALADIVHELVAVEPAHWRHLAHEATEQYLRENSSAVEVLAAALLVERTLTGERVRELVGELPVPDVRNLLGALDWWSRRAAERASPAAAEPAG
jgi:uncharacterized protein YdbL (DUF1318 family)